MSYEMTIELYFVFELSKQLSASNPLSVSNI